MILLPRHRIAAGLGMVAVIALTSCTASTGGYREAAEEFLRGDEMFSTYGIDFREPECTEPTSTDEGEVIACRADGDDGLAYEFTLRIAGRNELLLDSIRPIYDDDPPDPSAAGVAPPDSAMG